MATKVLLGVDVGTSGCKAILLDGHGRVVASASRTYPTRRHPSGEVTQDADDWLRAVERAVRECMRGTARRLVAAMSVTGPAHYAVLADSAGQPTGRVLLSSDGRPAAVADELRARIGEQFFEITGERLSAGWTFAQLVWLQRADPAAWQRARSLLVVKDYVRFRLTGERTTDPSDAAGTGLYDLRRAAWSAELAAEAGVALDMLPSVKPAVELGGRLSGKWAQRLGLPGGLPLAVGATDTLAELVSVGAGEPGDGIVKIASTGTAVCVTDQLQPHPALLAYPHALAGRWYSAAATSTAATAFAWLRMSLFGDETASFAEGYRRLNALAGRVPAGANGLLFLPFLEGERTPYWDADLRAAFLGMSSSHSQRDLCRAVLEGVALSLRVCRDTLADAGIFIARPVYAGGGTASPLWRTITASVLGLEGRLAEPQGPAVGAAFLAAAAVGVAPATDGNFMARPRSTPVKPRADWVAIYDELYDVYREAVSASTGVSHRLARLARTAPLS